MRRPIAFTGLFHVYSARFILEFCTNRKKFPFFADLECDESFLANLDLTQLKTCCKLSRILLYFSDIRYTWFMLILIYTSHLSPACIPTVVDLARSILFLYERYKTSSCEIQDSVELILASCVRYLVSSAGDTEFVKY